MLFIIGTRGHGVLPGYDLCFSLPSPYSLESLSVLLPALSLPDLGLTVKEAERKQFSEVTAYIRVSIFFSILLIQPQYLNPELNSKPSILSPLNLYSGLVVDPEV